MKTKSSAESGGLLMYVVFILSVLAAIVAAVVRPVSDEYLNTFRASGWQEALLAAESGIDLAMVQLKSNLRQIQPGNTSSWPSPWDPAVYGDQLSGSAAWPSPWAQPASGGEQYNITNLSYAGQDGGTMTATVTVDAPALAVDPTYKTQYYRIRSSGIAPLPPLKRAGGTTQDLDLRRYSLQVDRYSMLNGVTPVPALAYPQVFRTVEAIAQPLSSFANALLARNQISMSDQNVVVDSYDSTNAAKSTNGQYDPGKAQKNATVSTDGTLIAAENTQINGNLNAHNGAATGAANATGTISNDFYQDIPSVQAPVWTTFSATPASVGASTTLTSSASSTAPQRYKLSAIMLAGSNTLTITGTPGQNTYVEIWVAGNVSLAGNASIQTDPGVYVSLYIGGSLDLGGNGLQTGNGYTDERPAKDLIYLIQPPAGQSQTVSLHSNANMESAVYAPDAAVTIGGGSNGTFSGSVVGSTISITGVTNVHYDESLSHAGFVTSFKIVSWMEDTR